MAKVKLSTAQAIALRDAEIIGTSYVVKAKTQTVNALRRHGLIRETSTQLTVAGAVVAIGLDRMDLSRGHSFVPYDLGDADELFVIPAATSDVDDSVRADWEAEVSNVTVQPAVWETSGPVLETLDRMPECYWGDGRTVVAVWFDHVGNVEGACERHAATLTTAHVTMVPEGFQVEPAPVEVSHYPLVGVRQSRPGWQGVEHIHTEGCADVAREMKRFGQKPSDTFNYSATCTLADLVADNWADVASDTHGDSVLTSADAWEDMVSWSTDDLSGLRVMPCVLGILGGETPAGTVARDSKGWLYLDAGFAETETLPEADTRTSEDMEDTTLSTYTIDAHLAIEIDGVRVDLGWHTFTVEHGSEVSIPDLYGAAHGEWKRPGKANWSSVIIVMESETW